MEDSSQSAMSNLPVPRTFPPKTIALSFDQNPSDEQDKDIQEDLLFTNLDVTGSIMMEKPDTNGIEKY